jgi:SAM-dependent methyltransferase
MPALSDIARTRKIRYFLDPLPKSAAILEIGSGDGWVGSYLRSNGWTKYIGVDVTPPADVVGDIREWRHLGLKPESFDAIVAFEVIEHVDFIPAALALLKPGGKLLLTSPAPHMDWFMKALEYGGLNQRRTSPHSNLTYFSTIDGFRSRSLRTVAGLSQWGVFTK